jgi:lipopolysaccharide transport system ATP-binding protein
MSSSQQTGYAIRASGVAKCFQSYARPVHRLVQALYKQRKKLYEEFWALKGVDIVIERGETLGIIGKNGSGKSTFLQIIAGTLTPTAGTIDINGRISAILELGAGFNPEFTGVENARLNAAILGMNRHEIEDRLPGIIEFSELGEFVNRPVKTYSSGMYVRLAFSIAINLEPDILIIDEALAVGDVKFQRKCFRKLEQLRNQGVTILFVTHATDSVVAMCDRALLLEGGEVKSIGEPKHVVNQYLESMFFDGSATVAPQAKGDVADGLRSGSLVLDKDIDTCRRRATYNSSEYRWGSLGARIVDYLLLGSGGEEISTGCDRSETLTLRVAVYFEQPVSSLIYGFTLKTIDGAVVFGSNSELKGFEPCDRSEGEFAIIEFRFSAHLIPGEYFVSIGIVSRDEAAAESVLDRRYDLLHLKIREEKRDAFGVAAVDLEVSEDLPVTEVR